jgi:hypothetical protein
MTEEILLEQFFDEGKGRTQGIPDLVGIKQ